MMFGSTLRTVSKPLGTFIASASSGQILARKVEHDAEIAFTPRASVVTQATYLPVTWALQ
jgi:hypothetical protein